MTNPERCLQCGELQLTDTRAEPCQICLLNSVLTSPVPEHIGEYDILDVLGRGGMGVIYKARRGPSDGAVALKVMLSGELATTEERQRFFAEIRAARSLDHPNIVSIEDVGVHAGRPFYTMKVYPAVLADEM